MEKTQTKPNPVAEIARKYFKIDAERSVLLHDFCLLCGERPVYEVFEGFRKDFIAAVKAERPTLTQGSLDVYWSRFVRDAKQYAADEKFDFVIPDKPKSTSAAATKKAEQRANPYKDLDDEALKATVAAARQSALEAGAEPEKAKEAAKQWTAATEELAKRIKASQKAAEKADKELLEPRQKEIGKRVKALSVEKIRIVEALLNAMAGDAKEWGIVRAAMPSDAAPAKPAAKRKAA